MATFNNFQIGDFCQRTFAGILGFPVQQKQTGFLDILLNSPLSTAYQSIIQNGQAKRKYALTYATKACDESEATDLCTYEGSGFTPTLNNIEYSFDGAPKIATRVITIGSQSYRDWCDLNGGGDGYLRLLQQQLVAEIQTAYEKLEKNLLQAAYNNKGCYSDGTNTAKTIPLFLNATSGAPSVNPAWSFGVEQGLAELGLTTQSYYIGGGQFWQAGRVLQSQYQVPNTMLGVNSNAAPANFAYSSLLSQITTGDAYEKILVISPEAVALTTFSKVLNQFANISVDSQADLIPQLWSASFTNTAQKQAHAFVITDPIKGLVWDVYAVLEQCGADYELKFQAELTYRFHVLPMADRICYNNCFTGIQVYNLCPLPVAEPCEAPEPVVPTTPLCLTVTLPEPCTIAIPKGTALTFTRGGFTLTWNAPISYSIASESDLFLLLTSMFGANPGKGNWFIGECGITYNGNGALAAGAGTISAAGDCFEELDITIAACHC